MWKGTAAYNFFSIESSVIAPFFLMFGREAAVKTTYWNQKVQKYLGTENSIINIKLMSKLYLVVAHNLKEGMRWKQQKEKHKEARSTQNR